MNTHYTVAACYTGRTTSEGGRISVVASNGKRLDHWFSEPGSAFDIADMIRPATIEARHALTHAILAAVLVAQAAHYTGATRCGL